MNNTRTRIVSIILTLTLCLSLLSGCKDKEKKVSAPTPATKTASAQKGVPSEKEKSSEESPSIEAEKEGPSTDSKDPKSEKSKDTKTEKSKDKGATAAPSAPVKTIAPTVPSRTPDKSGLNNKPTPVENAKTSKDLANIDPEKAADSSYDTEAELTEIQTVTINPNEFTYIPYENFASHITTVWSNFIATERVIVDSAHMNEYLNYSCLPLKNSFYEENCHGYSVAYGEDPVNKLVYMEVTWVYYVTKEQYATCKTAAAKIVNGTSGTTVERIKAIHDRIAADTTYQLNVDGPYNNLINHVSDCDGYTAVFMICMDLLGVPSKAYTTSDHIFNCIQVGGKWYVVDVTWDDLSDKYGFIYSRYFLAGSSMYTNYPIIVNLVSSTDYNCARKLVVTDDAKFRNALGISSSHTYTLNDDSTVTVDGVGIFRVY